MNEPPRVLLRGSAYPGQGKAGYMSGAGAKPITRRPSGSQTFHQFRLNQFSEFYRYGRFHQAQRLFQIFAFQSRGCPLQFPFEMYKTIVLSFTQKRTIERL